jgi:GNAT superfamily N-acetyltransferase
MNMTEITVRVLDESEWSLYRDVRLRALAESPDSFTATLADEADREEQFWRDRMTRSHRLLAERGPVAQGIVSLGPYEQDPSAAEVFGLYVVPEARGTRVSWRLVEAAAALAIQQAYLQLYYWVGIDNGRAVGFAKNFGFRTTDYRRPTRRSDPEPGEEIAMMLPLEPDATSAPNPTSGQPASREGPLS